jgi:hypothetical protein
LGNEFLKARVEIIEVGDNEIMRDGVHDAEQLYQGDLFRDCLILARERDISRKTNRFAVANFH